MPHPLLSLAAARAELARRLARYKAQLDTLLEGWPDLAADFPIKAVGRYCSVPARVPMIESHIRRHVQRLRRAARVRPIKQTEPGS